MNKNTKLVEMKTKKSKQKTRTNFFVVERKKNKGFPISEHSMFFFFFEKFRFLNESMMMTSAENYR